MEVRHTEVHKRVLQYAGAHEDECTRVHCPYSMVCVDPDWATYDDYWCECADGDLDCAADDFDRLAECSAEEIGMKVGWWFSVISTSVNLSLCIAILIEAVDVEVPLFNFARPWLKGFLPKKVPTSKLVFLQVAAGIITTINICVFTEQMIFGILFGLSIAITYSGETQYDENGCQILATEKGTMEQNEPWLIFLSCFLLFLCFLYSPGPCVIYFAALMFCFSLY
eukprot:TRINITY_DN1024_c0_g1_i2.p1 TRINITY_DN1024_c0_g1~~TRINITY_DN1024_c0_g1_i2.p1  ORF type:complete len:225 (+),score=12.95 TRINITY_DN1024_c0_g1_i2:621-1295(+)